MTCPPVDDLLSGAAGDHAESCAPCQAILALAATRATAIACARVEALLAVRAGGALPAGSEPMLLEHLETCAACFEVARALETPIVADAVTRAADGDADFSELAVVEATCYVRGQEIGRGGMGRIVRARDRRLGREVAIKELIDERMRGRFEREARLTAKLQHPAIVSVHEAGRWPTGEPFYAMKYVAGQPLDRVVARMKTLDERLGLLPTLTTVVEAIAYAHSERVIHRDLKPQNILIGAFGEVVVIDWGLAKDLGTPPEATAPYRDDGGAVTRAGAGTPAYMAPEQTRGEEPDERVDVYALGATLHHVLASERPGVRPLPAETPRDLRDIVAKAMSKDRERRYRTATELAGELRRFQEGQLVLAHRYTPGELMRRWLQRHRRTVTLAAAFIVVLAAVATISVRRIVAERDRAEAQRRAAERLVDYMVGSLRDRLEPIGRLDVLADTGKEVERYFASVPVASETDVDVLRQRGRAAEILAWVDRDKGRFDDAMVEFERARQLCARRDELAPTSEAAGCVAQAIGQLGQLESDRGGTKAALEWFRQQRERLDAALVRYPKDETLRTLRADAQYGLGREYQKQGDHAKGREAFLIGIQFAEELLGDGPRRVDAIGELAALHTDLCNLETEDGHPEASLQQCDLAAELRGRQRALEPDDAKYEVWWAVAMSTSADAATLIGDWSLARAKLDPARTVLRRRVKQDPQNALWRSYLATDEMMACANELGSGRVNDAEPACLEAEAEFERLLQKDPDREVAAENLVAVDASLAAVYLAQRKLPQARSVATRAVQVANEWNAKQPGNLVWLVALSEAEWRSASVAWADGRKANGRAAAWKAFAAVVGTTSAGSADFQAELALARAGLLLADMDADAGDSKAAETGCRHALARLEPAVARWPHVVEFQGRLAWAAVRLAEMVENPAEAQALRERAVSLLEPLERRGALAVEFRGLLEQAHRSTRSP